MQSFNQTFVADNPGTHYWHGHTSLDRMDGLQGLIGMLYCAELCEYAQRLMIISIVLSTVIEDPNDAEEQALKELYDEERVLWLQDWYHKSGSSLRTCEFLPVVLFVVDFTVLSSTDIFLFPPGSCNDKLSS